MLPIRGPREDDEPEAGVPLRRSHGLTYVRRFLATKNSWKGKYARVFCVCETSALTLNPTTFEVTNEWSYANDLIDITCQGIDTTDFTITVRKVTGSSKLSLMARSTVKISFSSEHRSALITSMLSAKAAALAPAPSLPDGGATATGASRGVFRAPGAMPTFAGAMIGEGGLPTAAAMVVCPCALELRMMPSSPPGPQAEAAAQAAAAEDIPPMCAISFEDIEAVRAVRTDGGASGASASLVVIHHGGSRLTLISCERRKELLASILKAAGGVGIGIPIGPELGVPVNVPLSASAKAAASGVPLGGMAGGGVSSGAPPGHPLDPHGSTQAVIAMARGVDDASLLSPVFEATVYAFAADHDDLRTPPPKPQALRTLVLTDHAIVERDPQRMRTTCARPLSALHALLRDPFDEQAFALQYTSGACRLYSATTRDAILASILEAAHGAGHGGVHVLSNANARLALSLRLHPLSVPTDGDLEAIYLRALAGSEGAGAAWEGAARHLVVEFNANVPYDGVGAACLKKNEKLVGPALARVLKFGRSRSPSRSPSGTTHRP